MLPTTTQTGAVAKKEQKRLVDILKTDHNFDLIAYIINEMGLIQRSKKMKVLEKRRLIKDYSLALLPFVVPKMKIVEENTGNQTPINFQVNIEQNYSPDEPVSTTAGAKKKKGTGVSITIPTMKNSDGSYVVKE